MHPDEEATIREFIVPHLRARWLDKLNTARQRRSFLDRLNHCPDFDDRYVTSLAVTTNVPGLLRSRGVPATCHVIPDIEALDGCVLPLDEAIDQAESAGFGALFCCIHGRLAYHYGERGIRRFLLERSAPL